MLLELGGGRGRLRGLASPAEIRRRSQRASARPTKSASVAQQRLPAALTYWVRRAAGQSNSVAATRVQSAMCRAQTETGRSPSLLPSKQSPTITGSSSVTKK